MGNMRKQANIGHQSPQAQPAHGSLPATQQQVNASIRNSIHNTIQTNAFISNTLCIALFETLSYAMTQLPQHNPKNKTEYYVKLL